MERDPELRRLDLPGSRRRWLRGLMVRGAHGTGLLRGLRRLRPRRDLLVLAYHNLRAPPFLKRCAGIQDLRPTFHRQMDYLARHGSPVGETELLDWLDGGRPLPANPVLVTFDDGYRDTWEDAMPVLRSYGIPAVVFVTASCLDARRSIWPNRVYHWFDRSDRTAIPAPAGPGTMQPPDRSLRTDPDRRRACIEWLAALKRLGPAERRAAMDELADHLGVPREADPFEQLPMLEWCQVEELARSKISVGSHGLDHEIMTRLDPAELRRQMEGSRRLIQERTGLKVRGFAYPNGGPGDYDADTGKALQAAEYRYGMIFTPGGVTPEASRFEIPRIGPYDPNPAAFALMLAGFGPAACAKESAPLQRG